MCVCVSRAKLSRLASETHASSYISPLPPPLLLLLRKSAMLLHRSDIISPLYMCYLRAFCAQRSSRRIDHCIGRHFTIKNITRVYAAMSLSPLRPVSFVAVYTHNTSPAPRCSAFCAAQLMHALALYRDVCQCCCPFIHLYVHI